MVLWSVNAASQASGGIELNGAPEPNHDQAREEEVEDKDKDAGSDDGLRRRTADALRTTFGGKTVVAADRGDDEAEEDRLHQSHCDVLGDEFLVGHRPVLVGIDA